MEERAGVNRMSNVTLVKRIGGRLYRLTAPSPKYRNFPPYIPIKEALKWADKARKVGNLVHIAKSTINGKEYGLLYVYFAYDLKHEKK
jgi:hypothetical protein